MRQYLSEPVLTVSTNNRRSINCVLILYDVLYLQYFPHCLTTK